jgi:hypothetical protein
MWVLVNAVHRTACAVLVALVIFWVGAQSVDLSKAENIDLNQPRIVLHSPSPVQVYNSSSIDLSLEILKPSSWFNYGWFYKPSSSSSGIPFDPKNLAKGYSCIGRIDYLECILDSNTVQTFPITDYTPFTYHESPLNIKLLFSQSLSVPEGRHTLKITVFGRYATDSYYPNGSRIYQIVNSAVETSFRLWYNSPQISVISPQTKMYNGSDVPLTFELDRPVVCVYSLDGAGNVSLAGNITLSGIAEGSHSLAIYAKDPAGNVGKSDTVVFNVVFPTPVPSSSSSPYPSLTSTLEPTPTDSPAGNFGADYTLPILVGIVSLLVILGLIFYFKKRRK